MLIKRSGRAALLSTLAFSLSLTIGCAKEEEDEEEEEDPAGELAGTWMTACISRTDQDNVVESYERQIIQITGSTVIEQEASYDVADATCTGTAQYEVNYESTFVVGADVAAPVGAKEYTVTPTQVVAVIKTAAAVAMFNEGQMCGLTWVLDEPQVITTLSCGGGDGDARPMNSVMYDIYDVEGTTLTLGEIDHEFDGTTAAKRPTKLSTKDDIFVKVETEEE